jgi:hypothetical protein
LYFFTVTINVDLADHSCDILVGDSSRDSCAKVGHTVAQPSEWVKLTELRAVAAPGSEFKSIGFVTLREY